MSDSTAFDLLRAVEQEHIQLVAAQSKVREDIVAAHIEKLQEDLKIAERNSATSRKVTECIASISSVGDQSSGRASMNAYGAVQSPDENQCALSGTHRCGNFYDESAESAVNTKSDLGTLVHSNDVNKFALGSSLISGEDVDRPTAAPVFSSTDDNSSQDPLEILGRLVETTLGRQVRNAGYE